MELKKRLSLFILLILILAVFSAAAYAGKGADRPAAPTESHAADLMSFDAMVDRIAEENHITEQKAELLLPESIRADRDEPGIRYMSGKIPLDISHEYMPQIEFMCQVSGDGDDYRVISLFNPQLSAESPHTELSKQFVGTVKMCRQYHRICGQRRFFRLGKDGGLRRREGSRAQRRAFAFVQSADSL